MNTHTYNSLTNTQKLKFETIALYLAETESNPTLAATDADRNPAALDIVSPPPIPPPIPIPPAPPPRICGCAPEATSAAARSGLLSKPRVECARG